MMQTICIEKKEIGPSSPVFIIAEAGLNHNGRMKLAKQLVQKAAEVNINAIKFQTYVTKEFVNKNSPYFKLFKKYELSFEEFGELSDLAKDLGIIFLSTPLDVESVEFLGKLGVPAFKVSSGDLTNLPFLKLIANKGKPLLLSTGMANLDEVGEAINSINSTGNKSIALFHCVSCYPTALKDVNLRAMSTLKEAFQVPVGFSDHTLSPLTPIAAVAMGACLIEKHFTLSKKLSGPDHKCSSDVKEFKTMVSAIRDVEQMLGSSNKNPVKQELPVRDAARRSIIAKTRISKGLQIKESSIIFRRPGTGISPKDVNLVIGKHAKVNIECGELITWDELT